MTRQKPAVSSTEGIVIRAPEVGAAGFCLLGTSPLILHAMSDKARHELLLPSGRKTAAEKASSLKHNPPEEYRESVYAYKHDDRPTRLYFPSGGFRDAIANAGKDTPGVTASSLGRLVWIANWPTPVDIYGVPQIRCDIVRNSDMARTPDVRTRAIIPQWCAKIDVRYKSPNLSDQAIANLLVNAGLFIGVGDWRQEKGAGSFGQFEVVSEDDPRFMAIIKNGGRKQQDAALKNPQPFDEETEELLSWFDDQIKKMGDKGEILTGRRTNGARKVEIGAI